MQDAPNAVQVELAEGCNLRCSFCGINGIRGKEHDFKFMSVQVAGQVAKGIADAGWRPRVEFAMHGEPTQNPYMDEIVATFRSHLPASHLLVLSNGGGLTANPRRKIANLFIAGLSTLGLDEYQGIRIVPRLLEKIGAPANGNILSLGGHRVAYYDYPDDKRGQPHVAATPMRRLVRIRPIDLNEQGTHANLSNHAGAAAPLSQKLQGQRCAKPFRELSVRWDGEVAVCCEDWRGDLPIGNAAHQPLLSIWNDPVMEAVRRRLYHGLRDKGPCNGCTHRSYRVGLLPDKKGLGTMLLPTVASDALIDEALERGPLTAPVSAAVGEVSCYE